MKTLVENINAQVALFQANAEAQLVKGNKAAGTRARKAALELSKLLKEFRKVSVEETKKYSVGLFTRKEVLLDLFSYFVSSPIAAISSWLSPNRSSVNGTASL